MAKRGSLGSFSATLPEGRTQFRLRRTYYKNGKRKHESVKKTAWTALGFSESMTLEQAQARCRQLNGETTIKRQEQQSMAGIANRVERDLLHHKTFIPDDLNKFFIEWLEQNTSGSPKHIEKCKIIWGTVKRHLLELKLTPDKFAENKKKIFRYFSVTKTSLDYTKKQISLMNQYGRFCARLTGKWYEDIPMPTGIDREAISDAYLDSGKRTKESDPMDEDLLEILKDKLHERYYNWILVTFWFGLRPDELNMILVDRENKTWRVEVGETDALWVYQPKLKSVPRHKRWKLIPILFDEQRHCLHIINTQNAEMPSMHRLEIAAKGYRLTRYTGRKGFTDLMLSKGQDFVNISMWMGHTNLERTQKNYKDRLVVHFLNKKGKNK